MKTKNLVRFIVIIFSISSFVLDGCKKDKKEDPIPDSSSMQQLSKDQTDVDNASNEAINDVSNVISGGIGKSLDNWPCNATIDSSTIINDSIVYYITYSGLNCNNKRIRTGQVEVKKRVASHWGQPGTSVAVSYINLKVTKVSSGKSLILNGNTIFTNVSGGLIINLGNGITSITHTAVGSVQATFDDNTTRTWNINRKRTFTGTQGEILMTVDGQATINGYNNVVTWGINRNNENFYSQISQSIVYRQACDWDPVAGILIHQIPGSNKKVTATFGYDSNNMPVPVTSDNCPTKFKIDWENNGHSGTIYLEL
jgi:hypothetical protein